MGVKGTPGAVGGDLTLGHADADVLQSRGRSLRELRVALQGHR